MIKNLLRPKWRHPDAAIRCQAIEEGRLENDILLELAKTDPAPEVRATAVSRLKDIRQLIELADTVANPAGIGVPARLHDLLLAMESQAELDTPTLQRCFELCSDRLLRRSLLLQAPHTALRLMAAESVDQDDALSQCVLNDISSEVRRAAVSRIENEDTLHEIARQLRGSDKSTARLAEEKRTELQQTRQRAEQRRQLLGELQAFADVALPLNETVINGHFRRWADIAVDADSHDQARFESLQALLQPRLAEQRRLQEQEREGRSARDALLKTLAELAEHSRELEPQESEQRLKDSETGWYGLSALQNPALQQGFEQDFQEAVQRVRDLIKQQRDQAAIQHRLDSAITGLEARLQANRLSTKTVRQLRERSDSLTAGIDDRQTFEKPLQRIRNLVEKLENRLAEQQAQEKKWQGRLKTHVEALESALRDKTLKPALAAHKKAHDLLKTAGEPRPVSFKSLEQRLHHCEPALRELKSWRNYGTDHAREELINEAIVLRDAPPADVEKLAKQLTDLRGRWKALGPLEPGGKAHWEQFDAACTQAHEPVKAKRDAEAEMRRKHLEQRKAICEQLEQLVADTDWEQQPDWHALDRAMGEARRHWNKTGGVPHKAWSAIKKRFDNAVKDLDDHLAQERERNYSYRQGLVRKAEALTQEQDNRTATAAARDIRQLWQVTVHSHHRKEKQIWQAFTNAMDQIFQKDRAARDQFRASLDENRHQAEALCEQLEQQVSADDKTVRSHRGELPTIIDQFNALNLPKQNRRQLENRFDKACKALERRIEKADEAVKGEQIQQLYALHKLCALMEAVALGGQPDEQAAGGFEAQWSDAEKPAREKSVLHELERRYQATLVVIKGEQSAATLGDLAANAECKRGICTDLEILLHMESPPEERSQRMQRQIEILENAMKGGDKATPERIRELRLAYMACGPVEPALLDGLEQRFSVLLNAQAGKD